MNLNDRKRRRFFLATSLSLALTACGVVPPAASPVATQVTTKQVVMITSGGFASTSMELIPDFEQSSGYKVRTVLGSSMGGAIDSIPSRLSRAEPADVVILARSALDELVAKGQVVPGSQVDLVNSLIGFSVKKGTPKPDISSADAVRRTLLEMPSIAYSASASGTYYENEMLKTLGIEAQVKPKSKRIVSERVGTVVARGDAVLGMQQVSELLPIEGLDFVGVLPTPLQRVTVFSAGVTTNAKDPAGARKLIEYFNSPAAEAAIRKNGLEPARVQGSAK